MDSEYIINSVKQTSETLYRQGDEDQVERLCYRIQMLESHIRILHQHLGNFKNQLETIKTELDTK